MVAVKLKCWCRYVTVSVASFDLQGFYESCIFTQFYKNSPDLECYGIVKLERYFTKCSQSFLKDMGLFSLKFD